MHSIKSRYNAVYYINAGVIVVLELLTHGLFVVWGWVCREGPPHCSPEQSVSFWCSTLQSVVILSVCLSVWVIPKPNELQQRNYTVTRWGQYKDFLKELLWLWMINCACQKSWTNYTYLASMGLLQTFIITLKRVTCWASAVVSLSPD